MPKLVLRTPEEYTAFPILVDGTTYDIVTVDGPATKTATISKSTVAQLESGNFGGVTTDLLEVNLQIDSLNERLVTVEGSIEEINATISTLPTSMPSLDNVNTRLDAVTNELTTIKSQISNLQAKDVQLTELISALTARVNVLEGKCPCCGCTTTPTTPSTQPTTQPCGCGC